MEVLSFGFFTGIRWIMISVIECIVQLEKIIEKVIKNKRYRYETKESLHPK